MALTSSGSTYLYFFCRDRDANCMVFYSSRQNWQEWSLLERSADPAVLSYPYRRKIPMDYFNVRGRLESRPEIPMAKFISKEEKELSVMFVWLRDLLSGLCTPPRENAVKTWKRKQRSQKSQAWTLLLIACLNALANFAHSLCDSSPHTAAASPLTKKLYCAYVSHHIKFGIDTYTLLYLKWITNKVLLYRTGNSAQCHVAAWMGGAFGGDGTHVYVSLSPITLHLKLSQPC